MIQNFWQMVCHDNKLNNRITKLWNDRVDPSKLFSVQQGVERIFND